MLGEHLRHCKNASARSQGTGHLYWGDNTVELNRAGDRDVRVASRQDSEPRVELGAQVDPARDTAKLDNFGTHRKRCQELRALQRRGRIREYREAVVVA